MFKVIEHPADCEMRSVIRFLNARNIKQADIHHQLCEVYGDDAISDGMVRRWVRKFNEGRISVHDEQHTGRPSLINDDLVHAVDEKIHEDMRFTISSLSLNFPQMLRSGSQAGEFYNEGIERLVPDSINASIMVEIMVYKVWVDPELIAAYGGHNGCNVPSEVSTLVEGMEMLGVSRFLGTRDEELDEISKQLELERKLCNSKKKGVNITDR
ncbi:hypothetical protein ANN_13559 [Periplaneta americana]|uniref:Mos1 transposase HTH domain-containing protein n=1 Tax=Periplaneta americana TaxID=6978 RepID=A0ABQ8TJR3_PERAM|nr:hypothetical protein ANN_13559 [Periplaneta americana]